MIYRAYLAAVPVILGWLKVDWVKRLIVNSVVDPDLDPVRSGTFSLSGSEIKWNEKSSHRQSIKL